MVYSYRMMKHRTLRLSKALTWHTGAKGDLRVRDRKVHSSYGDR